MNALEFHQPTRFIVASDGSVLDRRRAAFAPFSIDLSASLSELDASFYGDFMGAADDDLDAFIGGLDDLTFAAIALGRVRNTPPSGMSGGLM